jgi:hypothetical protein
MLNCATALFGMHFLLVVFQLAPFKRQQAHTALT